MFFMFVKACKGAQPRSAVVKMTIYSLHGGLRHAGASVAGILMRCPAFHKNGTEDFSSPFAREENC